jgi:hypothetical protein
MTTYYTNDMEFDIYYKIVQSLDNNYIDLAKSLLFDIYDVDNTIFDDNRIFTKVFYSAFENKSLYFMRLLLNLGLDVNSYIYTTIRTQNITIFNFLIQQILKSYNSDYILVEDDFIVEAFKMIFEYSKIDYDRGDINYYVLLYNNNRFNDIDKQRLINLLEIAKTNTNTYTAKQRLTLGKVDSMFGEYLDIDTLNKLGKSLMHQSFNPNMSFNRNNPYETYGEHLKRKSMLERKKYMQKRSDRKFAKRTRKKRKPKRF